MTFTHANVIHEHIWKWTKKGIEIVFGAALLQTGVDYIPLNQSQNSLHINYKTTWVYTFPNSSYKLCNVHVFARAHCSHATQLGQPISCCRGSGSVLLQKWLNICYAVAQCRNLLKSSKICSWLLPHLQESMDLIIVSTLLQLFVLLM